MGSFVVASAILWALEKLIVLPLTMFMLRRRLAGLAQPEAQRMATRAYMITDTVVLATAGLIAGIAGFRFIGITFSKKGWPGMLAFIGCSFLGAKFFG